MIGDVQSGILQSATTNLGSGQVLLELGSTVWGIYSLGAMVKASSCGLPGQSAQQWFLQYSVQLLVKSVS